MLLTVHLSCTLSLTVNHPAWQIHHYTLYVQKTGFCFRPWVKPNVGPQSLALELVSVSGHQQSQSHFTAVSQSVSQSVCLGVEPTLWTFDQILLPFQVFESEICCLVFVGCPLWWEAASVLCKSQSSHLSVCIFTIYIFVFHTITIYIYIYIYIYNADNTYKASFSPGSV
jgi:hypothetical protein